VAELVDSRKEKIDPKGALRLVRAADEVWVARGQKVVRFDLQRDRPSDEELLRAIIGPSGNLRAPAVRRGKRLFVGFNDAMYEALVG
jgi:arsenate reductase-like glutaredoxin family protein